MNSDMTQGQRHHRQDAHHSGGHELLAFGELHSEEDQQKREHDIRRVRPLDDTRGTKCENSREDAGRNQRSFAARFDEAHHPTSNQQHDINPQNSIW